MRRLGSIFLMFLLSIGTVNCVEQSLLATVSINPIYDLSLEIEVITERVLAGDNISVSVGLEKEDLSEFGKGKEITVDLTYQILRPRKKLVDSGYAGEIKVKEYNETTIQIPVPTEAKPGRYILKMTASNPQAISSSDSDDFTVVKKIVKMSMDFFKLLVWFFDF